MSLKKIRLLLTAFLIGLGGYFFYGWILVPNFIIPPRSIQNSLVKKTNGAGPRLRIKQQSLYNAKLLSSLFPEGDWRLKKPSMVIGKNPDCRFLYDGDFSLSPDHREITLLSCTVVIPSTDESLSLQERYQQGVVIETKDCLTLRFRSPLEDISSGISLDLLEEGKLSGEVNIRSSSKLPGPEDDFQISVIDLTFSREQIVTDNLVVFHYGACQGEGTGLRVDITLPNKTHRQPTEDENVKENPFADYIAKGNLLGGFSIGEIRLAKLNRLEFEMEDYLPELPKESFLGGDRDRFVDFNNSEPTDNSAENNDRKPTVKLDLRCQDEVYFAPNLAEDPANWGARFSGSVEVTACHDEREPDTLQCETLYFYLVDKKLKKLLEEAGDSYPSRKKPTGNLTALEASQIKAIGTEEKDAAILIAKDFLQASGNEILCNIPERRFSLFPLREDRPVILDYAQTRVSSAHIDFTYDPKNYGNLIAYNKGKIQSEYRNENGDSSVFNIAWQNGVQIIPVQNSPSPDHPETHVASFRGGVQFGWENMGNVRAEETDFWFTVQNKEKNPSEQEGKKTLPQPASIEPVCAQFRNGVHLETVRGAGTIHNEVNIRFIPEENNSLWGNLQHKENARTEPKKKDGNFLSGEGNLLGGEIKSMFKMEGNRLDLWASLGKTNDLTLSKIKIQENIRFVETSLEDQLEILRIEGNEVWIEQPDSPKASVTLRGWPASFNGMGLNLNGYDIRVDRANNRFSVIGEGHLRFDAQKEGKTSASNVSLSQQDGLSSLMNQAGGLQGEPVEVWWQREMSFDGQNLTFEGKDQEKVLVRQGKSFEMRSPSITLALKDRIEISDFDREGKDSKEKKNFELATSSCRGNAQLPVEFSWRGELPIETKEGKSNLTSVFYGEVETLSLTNDTGDLYALGPGWLRGTVQTPNKGVSFMPETQGKRSEQTQAKSKPWTKIHLTFDKELFGNVKHQDVKVDGNVRSVFGTVDRMDALVDVGVPSSFPEDAFYLTCDELGFAATPTANTSERFFEMFASGNTRFQYQKFTGMGEMLKYNNLKKTVSLQGNGVSQASINYQESPGRPVNSQHFSSLLFNLETKKIESNISGTSHRIH